MKKTISKGFSKAITIPILALAVVMLLGSCSGKKNTTPQKTFVIVHGAYQGPYAWTDVKTQLESQGQKVIVVQLPGHGTDTTNPANISMASYRDTVLAAISGIAGTVVLVGHSMGGMVVSEVAEAVPGKVEKIIFLAAFIPYNGQTLFQIASQDSVGQLGPLLVPSANFQTIAISDTTKIPQVFCADGSAQVQQELLANYRPEPGLPFNNPVTVTSAGFGSVSKVYIHTANDMALGMPLQNRMVSWAGITKVYSINSSHCPQLSMPVNLSTFLLQVAQ